MIQSSDPPYLKSKVCLYHRAYMYDVAAHDHVTRIGDQSQTLPSQSIDAEQGRQYFDGIELQNDRSLTRA